MFGFKQKFNPKSYKGYPSPADQPWNKDEELLLDFFINLGVKKEELVWFRQHVHAAYLAPDVITYIHRDLIVMIWDFLKPIIQGVTDTTF